MKQPPIFALIDCNNFFVSCERLFRPDLEGKPVVVLSSNDGCAVSRSNEAKALGIPMAAPVFKYRDIMERYNIVKFSANFELYGNISRRITALLTSVTPRIEIYSVDESFLDLSGLPITDYEAWGKEICDLIFRWVGIPVSIGIAPSKTMAKLANLRAKKNPYLGGVLSLYNIPPDKLAEHLRGMAVSDVWGIGWRLSPKLRAEGISNALDVSRLRPQRAQQLMGIHGRQMVAELNGTSCYPLNLEGKLPQTIAVTRTFGEDTTNTYVVEAAIATFASSGSFKLRRSQQLTRRASIFVATNRHKPGYAQWKREVTFAQPTADTGQIITVLTNLFRELHHQGINYHRAGILLYDFIPDTQLQTDLLGVVDTPGHDRSIRRMAAVDAINNQYGKRSVRYAAEDLAITWQPRHQLRSPGYVSNWDELPPICPNVLSTVNYSL